MPATPHEYKALKPVADGAPLLVTRAAAVSI
jgi:hypothetical protein